MMTNLALGLLSALIAVATAGEQATIDIVHQGNCPPRYLKQTLDLPYTAYIPRLTFLGVNVTFLPKNPTVPGCFTVRVTDVNVLKPTHKKHFGIPLKKVSAEYDLRIGGSPDAGRGSRHMKCGKTKQSSDCPCLTQDNSCMVCGFCKNLQRNGKELVFNKLNKKYDVLEQQQLGATDRCACKEEFEPGLYTLETEICTPEKEELMGDMTNDELEVIASEKKITMWATINIYDKEIGYDSRTMQYLSVLPDNLKEHFKNGIKEKKKDSLVGCFMLGYNVKFNDS